MTIQDFIQQFQNDARSQELIRDLKKGAANRISVQGLAGSAAAMLVAAVFQNLQGHHLVIMNDWEEAIYFQNNLESLLGDKQIALFPGSYRKPYTLASIDNNAVLMRAEVLNRISKNEGSLIVVSTPEAINEKVVTKKTLISNTMDLSRGDKISINFITEFLTEYDFELVDFVSEAGQYAVRGGIVDIYSFAHDMPFRLEFFGDEVESIRTFDPENQLSVQLMHRVTIIPNVKTRLMQESRESFFDFIKAESKIWFKDLKHTLTLIETGYQRAAEERSAGENLIEQLPIEEVFETKQEVKAHLEKFTSVELNNHPYYQNGKSIVYKQSPQPSFNKNFDLVYETLLNNKNNGYLNLILADQPRQIERIYTIFDDLAKKPGTAPFVVTELFTAISASMHEGFVDHNLKIALYTDHQIFDRYHRFRLKKNYSKKEALTLKELYGLKPGDFVVHIDHGIGRFGGLEKMEVNGKPQEALRLIYKDNDILYVSIHSLHRVSRFTGKEGTQPTLNKLGSANWATLKQKTKSRVKDIAKDLIALYAKRKNQKGFAFTQDTYLQTELEASFIYEDTKDQEKATRDVKHDMEKPHPMDRLVCGDVGFGKTEVALRAAFKAVADSKQVAILVPTTILALQHYKTFSKRLADFPCTVDYINRFKTTKEQKATLKLLEEGKIDILIGTHRLLGKDIKFKDLGLMIIDEEQKFGVAAKEKLKALKLNVDCLTLTATPIPRTLQFSLMGARDLSIINTPPPNRQPVTTELHTFNEKVIKEAVEYEIDRGGQVFFIHNRVNDLHDIAVMVERLCKGAKVAVAHGQMDGEKLEEIMLDFIEGDYDVLVATTIIESGLDIPNANTIIINNAHYFGLSDLHQMRGRVGRSNKKAFCYLLSPPLTVLTPEARQRLSAIEQFSELGSGFNVAMRDLDIRGAGNMLGGEQSGFISEIGYETFQKILDEAIQELKDTEFKDLFADEQPTNTLFVRDCQIDTDMEILLPDWYVENITERLSLYRDLDEIEEEEKLIQFGLHLKDRFGPLPKPVLELMNTIRLRWLAKEIGFEKLVLKNNKLLGYFISNSSSPFYDSAAFSRVLQFVQSNKRAKLKEIKEKLTLTFENVDNVEQAIICLKDMVALEV